VEYEWTNELMQKGGIGTDFLTFEPDFSDPLIQFFGEESEYLDIYVAEMG